MIDYNTIFASAVLYLDVSTTYLASSLVGALTYTNKALMIDSIPEGETFLLCVGLEQQP